MNCLLELKGTDGTIFAYNDWVTVSRQGALAHLHYGSVDEHTYFYTELVKVNYKKPGIISKGYITLVIASEGTKIYETVVLRSFYADVPVLSEELYRLILRKINESRNLRYMLNIKGLTSRVDELEKLAELRTSGMLTEREYQMEKSKLLNS